jgi:hypothetical protein
VHELVVSVADANIREFPRILLSLCDGREYLNTDGMD